ncbi:MAG: polysaccharide deacetylase family protein [Candidatus Omnitrophota bacterium]
MKKTSGLLYIILFLAGLGLLGVLYHVYSVPVLMYHSIDGDAYKSRLSVTPESFQRQMRFLKENKYRILTLSEYVDLLKLKKKPRQRSVVITFDDGFESNYTDAYPTLKEYNIPATIFVVANWVGEPGMMSWEQIKEISDTELIEIGSHTLDHNELTKIRKDEARRQVKDSKMFLAEKLHKKINFLCYPCGSFDGFIRSLTELSGYKGACATHPGGEWPLDDEFAIRRIRISRSADNMIVFWAQVSGYYSIFKDRKIENKKNEENTCY